VWVKEEKMCSFSSDASQPQKYDTKYFTKLEVAGDFSNIHQAKRKPHYCMPHASSKTIVLIPSYIGYTDIRVVLGQLSPGKRYVN